MLKNVKSKIYEIDLLKKCVLATLHTNNFCNTLNTNTL